MTPQENVSLAEHCTLGVGGPARYFMEVTDEAGVREGFEWARRRDVPLARFRAVVAVTRFGDRAGRKRLQCGI